MVPVGRPTDGNCFRGHTSRGVAGRIHCRTPRLSVLNGHGVGPTRISVPSRYECSSMLVYARRHDVIRASLTQIKNHIPSLCTRPNNTSHDSCDSISLITSLSNRISVTLLLSSFQSPVSITVLRVTAASCTALLLITGRCNRI